MKPKTLIVYEDNAADIEKAAHGMFRIAEKSGAPARIDAASSVTVAETLAADLLVFGVKTPKSPAFSELDRLFKGVNLAGRRAAFFRDRDSKGVESLKASLKDTDISLYSPDLDISSSAAEAAAWIKAAMNL